MKSILDNGDSWILEKLEYENELDLYLKELKRGKPKDLEFGDGAIKNVTPLQPAIDSMRIKVSFDWYLSWQCLNESATTDFKGDVDDGKGFINVLSKSNYLDYIVTHHGWYADIQDNPAIHYRVWSENEVIDIVAFGAPKVELLNP